MPDMTACKKCAKCWTTCLSPKIGFCGWFEPIGSVQEVVEERPANLEYPKMDKLAGAQTVGIRGEARRIGKREPNIETKIVIEAKPEGQGEGEKELRESGTSGKAKPIAKRKPKAKKVGKEQK